MLARFIDAVLAFPLIVLSLALAAVFGPSLAIVIGVITFFSWAGISRDRPRPDPVAQGEGVHRGGAIARRGPVADHVHRHPAERARPRARARHLFIPTAVSFEATLSYPRDRRPAARPRAGATSSPRRSSTSDSWWYVVFPAAALLITTLAFNLLGDGIRDAMDPRTERLLAGREAAASASGGGAGRPRPRRARAKAS